jgi:hypothetical protein
MTSRLACVRRELREAGAPHIRHLRGRGRTVHRPHLGLRLATVSLQIVPFPALTANAIRGGNPSPSPISASASASNNAVCAASRSSGTPTAVAVHGFSRTTSAWPTRCSSALIRWLTAEGVTCSRSAAASNDPCSTTDALTQQQLSILKLRVTSRGSDQLSGRLSHVVSSTVRLIFVSFLQPRVQASLQNAVDSTFQLRLPQPAIATMTAFLKRGHPISLRRHQPDH